MDGKTIKLAPVWFLVESDFEIVKGNEVMVRAAQCAQPSCGDWFALYVKNKTSGAEITLRDDNGVPLWNRGRGNGQGPNREPASNGQGCVDPASIRTVSGAVAGISSGYGIQQPALTLKTASGETLAIKIGPERLFLATDMELNPGMSAEAHIGLATSSDEWVALSLTAGGRTVILRNDNGTPAW